ncbi:VCBS repeat-containing protein [Deinococcus sp. 12RED42]|uniref:FG-GAP repeat domain-containing protein n=1 Tax=Deinococcus sp. 12RED42 TaxID=2745872 RepID=UPI001E408CE9|nr:VCBS repeat-containing protein [Deinococcus sp. 12RED42]MCD0166748.1 VCBS repeat-containing protein [Deinococcus sp. 12RED42]
MPRFRLLLLSAALLTACGGPGTPHTTPPPGPSPTPAPSPAPAKQSRPFRVTIMGLGSGSPTAQVTRPGLSTQALNGLDQVEIGDVQVRATTDLVPPGQTRTAGARYVFVTLAVKNNAYGNVPNLTVIPTGLDTNTAQSAFTDLQRYPGLPAYSAAEAQTLALSIHPASPVTQDPLTLQPSLLPGEEDTLQLFDESEVSLLGIANGFGGENLPYGFVAHNRSSRTIPGSDGTNPGMGTVTLGFRVPLQAQAKDDLYSLSGWFTFAQDTVTSATESLEAQLPGNRAAFDRMLSQLFPQGQQQQVRVLPGTNRRTYFNPYSYSNVNVRPVCGVRLGGTSANPTGLMLNSPAVFAPDGPRLDRYSPLSLALCRTNLLDDTSVDGVTVVNHWSQNAPSRGTPTVAGNRVTVPVWTDSNGNQNGGYTPGQTVDVTLTAGVTAGGQPAPGLPFVYRTRVQTAPASGTYSLGGSSPFYNYINNQGSTLTNLSAMAIADLNGDGYGGEMMVTSRSSNELWLGTTTIYPVGTAPSDLGTGDLNGDGQLDAFTSNAGSGDVSVLLGNGDGTLQPATSVAVGAGPESIDRADLNGDGQLDLITANRTANTVSVLLNSSGTFSAQPAVSVGAQPSDAVTADVNGDGRMDLLVAATGGNAVNVRLGAGNGTFSTAADIPVTAPIRVASGDFNNDGREDVAALSSTGVHVALGNGDGTFGAPTTLSVGSDPRDLLVGDANGDGWLDVLTADHGSNSLSVLLGGANGFTAQAPTPLSYAPNRLVQGSSYNTRLYPYTLGDDTYTILNPQ